MAKELCDMVGLKRNSGLLNSRAARLVNLRQDR
jgi:hypothetical protein